MKSGLKFSDGSPITAAALPARDLPRLPIPIRALRQSPFADELRQLRRRSTPRRPSLTGVTAKGQKLTIKLLQADPTFIAQLSMPFFAAVKPNMAIDAKGIDVYPSGGPYKIVVA